MKNVLKKLKLFLKKYGLFVAIASVILILSVFVIVLLVRDKEDAGVVPPPDSRLSKSLPIEQPLGYHKNYKINIPSSVVSKLDSINEQYSVFKIKDVDHLSWIQKFVQDIGKGNLEYTKQDPTPELTIYYWTDTNNSISYNLSRDVVYMKFEQPILLPNINFNPRDEASLVRDLKSLAKSFFSEDFDYRINEVSRDGNYYRVNYARILNNIPIYIYTQSEYMLLTPDGRLKEATFLLAEFEEYTEMKYPLISSSEFTQNVSSMEYPKIVDFSNLDPRVDDNYEPYGYRVYHDPFLQQGTVDVNELEIVYLYSTKFQEVVAPTFLLRGTGLLEIDGNSESADFVVLASALKSEYVYVHPQSHFDKLGNY